jgi:site-specific DNA-cytosine methylase
LRAALRSAPLKALVAALLSSSAVARALPAAFSDGLRQRLAGEGLAARSLDLMQSKIEELGYRKDQVGIFDFTLPSDRPRFFLINWRTEEFRAYRVAHGASSGGLRAARFSNRLGTGQSSLGFILTDDEYYGQFGRSLRLKGLSPSNKEHLGSRLIVIHGAEYASPEFLRKHGYWGRSYGCFSFHQAEVDEVIDALGSRALLLAYHDELWEQIARNPLDQQLARLDVPPVTAWEVDENSHGSPHAKGQAPSQRYKAIYGGTQ